MAIDLKTIKRGSDLLQEKKEIINKVNKKLGRKKIEEQEKFSEKVVTYVTKQEKERLEKLSKAQGVKLAQYFRTKLLNNINE